MKGIRHNAENRDRARQSQSECFFFDFDFGFAKLILFAVCVSGLQMKVLIWMRLVE